MSNPAFLVLGDVAARALQALRPEAQILVARDDLPVGPLHDVDQDAHARCAFWEQVNPFFPYRFSEQLAQERALLAALPEALTLVIGESCGEELLLRRLAWWRGETPFSVLRVRDCAHRLDDGSFALGMCRASELQSALAQTAQPLTAYDLAQLAAEWETVRASDGLRSWENGVFNVAPIDALDDELWLNVGTRWEAASLAVNAWMANSRGFFRSDWLGSWRMALLGRTGRVEFAEADPDFSLARSRVRRAQQST